MKPWLLAAGIACGLAPPAQAQSVTLYGIVDLAVEHLTHVNASGASLNRMPSVTGISTSRLGFRGEEDLGGGLKAVFILESGIAPATGRLNYGGRIWGRLAHIGLSGPFGSLVLGRQANMTTYAVLTDVMGPSLYSIASLDPYLPNARSDNAIGYLGQAGGFTAGATYSFGRDASSVGGPAGTNCPGDLADGKACRQWTVLAKYDTAGYGGALSHDRMHGGPGAGQGLDRSDYTDSRSVASAWGRLGPVRLAGGLVRRQVNAAAALRSKLWYLGLSYPATPALTIDVQAARLDLQRSRDDSRMFIARAVYALSKRTAVYTMLGHMHNGGAAARSISAGGTAGPGLSQTGMAAGLRHIF
jgi:predicted porin